MFFTMYNGTISSVSPRTTYLDEEHFTGDTHTARIALNFTRAAAQPGVGLGRTHRDPGRLGSGYLRCVDLGIALAHERLRFLPPLNCHTGCMQDRSLTADAVTFPAQITIIKDATS